MTERCTHCRGTGRIDVQSRLYEYPSFSTSCYVCGGHGVHPKAFSLSMAGEQKSRDCLREQERWSQRYADAHMGETDLPPEDEWIAEQIYLEQVRMAAE